jgi:hypothetical protein
VLSKNLLGLKSINSKGFLIERFMEMVYRWSFFFKREELIMILSQVYFSPHTIGNHNPSVVQASA